MPIVDVPSIHGLPSLLFALILPFQIIKPRINSINFYENQCSMSYLNIINNRNQHEVVFFQGSKGYYSIKNCIFDQNEGIFLVLYLVLFLSLTASSLILEYSHPGSQLTF